MPLYLFGCGEHDAERRVPVGTTTVACHCGREARRGFDMTAGQIAGRHASEFEIPETVRGLIDEATHFKGIALREKNEAEANGFRR
ncbi:MAG TPA: hypothetical protein VFH61_18625 [Thermoleophilia bacterium]|nr:hypothetical protein [Thermoleophilia bacterium]